VLCCIMLYYVVLCCAVLCFAVLCCIVLYYAVLCCIVLYYAVLCCAVLYYALLCCAVLCFAVLCCAVLCCTMLCCAVLPPDAPHWIFATNRPAIWPTHSHVRRVTTELRTGHTKLTATLAFIYSRDYKWINVLYISTNVSVAWTAYLFTKCLSNYTK